MYRVMKRDGSMMEFHIAKIGNAITKAFEAVGRQYHPSVIELLALRVTAEFETKIRHDLIAVEDIQDCVERVLSEAGYADVAKAYILYRKQREKLRNVGSTLLNYKELVDNYLRINDWRVKENSTVTYSVGGLILSNSGAITANYWLSEIYDQEGANAILGGCTALLVVVSLVITVLFQVFKDPMLLLFGASENTLGYASNYLGIYLWGTIAVQLSLGLNNFITTQGFSTVSMLTVIIGAVCNIVLDPVLIFGFDMGVQGAALATILSQAVSALWVLRFLTGKRSRLTIQARHLRLDPKVLLPVMAIGVSPFIMQSTESLVNIALNSSLKLYGGDTYVGAMTIASSIMQVLVMPLQGLTQGAQPILGFNFGAGKTDRVRRTFKLLFLSCIALSTVFFLSVQLFPRVFIAIFNDKEELVRAAEWALHVYFGGMFMLGMQFSCQQTFVALGQAKVSLFLALLRKVILLVPLAVLLPWLSGSVMGLYAAELINVLRDNDPELMLFCVTPYEEQATKWTPELRERYFDMLVKCSHMTAVYTHKQPDAQLKAYRTIIRQSDMLLAVYDPASARGDDTDKAVSYARELRCPMLMIHPDTLKTTYSCVEV